MIWFFLNLVYRIPSNIWRIFMSFGRRAVYSLLIVSGKDWKSLPTNAKSIIWEKNGMVRKPPKLNYYIKRTLQFKNQHYQGDPKILN